MQFKPCMYSKPRDTSNNWRPVRWVRLNLKDSLTNFDLGALGTRTIYSLKLPSSIRSEMEERGEMYVSTPRSGNMFGWFKFFQVITSL